ncbi:MAG: alpha/beta fold hydrolase [Gammaproteobacteria bacterium]
MPKTPYICFSHGKESGPWGTKIAAMADLARDRGLDADSLDYRGIDDPVARVDKLVAHCAPLGRPLVLVGSSMGGHVAAAAAMQLPDVRGLFLLAPAFFMPGYEEHTPEPRVRRITIVHGWRDDIVPPANSIRFAGQHRAVLHLIDGDHRLAEHIFEINRFFDWFLDDV